MCRISPSLLVTFDAKMIIKTDRLAALAGAGAVGAFRTLIIRINCYYHYHYQLIN